MLKKNKRNVFDMINESEKQKLRQLYKIHFGKNAAGM